MNNEAFAMMIAAKYLIEDATAGSDPADALDELGSYAAIQPTVRDAVSRVDEQSFGPANIPLRQAHLVAEFWQCSLPEIHGLLFSSFRTGYFAYQQGYYGSAIPAPYHLDTLVVMELNAWDASGASVPSGTWYEWVAAAMLQSAYRASTFKERNNTSTWKWARSSPISAYIIALGMNAYNETDKTLYDLCEWDSPGLSGNWADAIQSVKDNLGQEIGWMQHAQWLPYSGEEIQRLRNMGYSRRCGERYGRPVT